MRTTSVLVVLLLLGTAVFAGKGKDPARAWGAEAPAPPSPGPRRNVSHPGQWSDWKPMSMSLDACVARAATAMNKAGLDAYKKGHDADANGPYGYVIGRAEGYSIMVFCIQRQALVVMNGANNPNASQDQLHKMVKTIYDSF